jgi:pSer/pThr/pTyr-binding forkhead associated (FHA) protein
MASLSITIGLKPCDSILLSKDSMLIGRDPRCDIAVPLHHMSRRHARIVRSGEFWGVFRSCLPGEEP